MKEGMSGEMGDDPVAWNSLLCGENRDFIGFVESEELSCPQRSSPEEDPVFVLGDECEHVEELIRKEPGWGLQGRRLSGSAKDLFRSESVDWIVNTSACFGFHFHTTYLSITYFDRFLVVRSIEKKSWAVRLLSLASLSLAAKMEECKVPALPDFCVQCYVFDSKCIKKMELLILTTLEWRMASVTPYAYLRFFIHKFFGESCDTEKELLFVAMDLVLAISKEINTLDFRPSVVAAAAVLASTGDELTRNAMASKTRSISSGFSLEDEHVYECYSLIQDIKLRRNSKTPGEITPFSSLSKDTSCCNPTNGSRKRLLFRESHQAPPADKMLKGNSTNASTDTK